MKYWIILAGLLKVVMLIFTQCSLVPGGQTGPPQIKIREAWSPAATVNNNGAVYFKILNEGSSPDVLLKVETDVGVAELYETKIDTNGIWRKGPLSNIEIPAGATISLEADGKYIALADLKKDLIPGELIGLNLSFQHTNSIVLRAEVRQRDQSLSVEHHNRQHVLDRSIY